MPAKSPSQVVELFISESWTASTASNYPRALTAAKAAVRAAEALKDPALIVRALEKEEVALRHLGDNAGAMVRCTRILAIAEDPSTGAALSRDSAARAVCNAYTSFVHAARHHGRNSRRDLLKVLDAAEQWLVAAGHRDWRARILLERAELHSILEEKTEALGFAQEAFEISSGNGPSYSKAYHHNCLGRALSAVGRHDEAVQHFNAALDASSSPLDSFFAYSYLAERAADTGRPHDARRHADSALTLAEGCGNYYTSEAYCRRGKVCRLLKSYDEALADYSRAIELRPDFSWAFDERGFTYEALGRNEEALAAYDRSIELDPSASWTTAQRGHVKRVLDRMDEALADLGRAIELRPEYCWAFEERGFTYQALGRNDEALADYERAVELDPSDSWAVAHRGKVYRLMGRHLDALADYSRAIELKPGYCWAFDERGFTYQALGRDEEALADYDRAVEIDPADTWAIERREKLRAKIDGSVREQDR